MDLKRLQLEIAADNIDRLVTLDFHARGVMAALYQAARLKVGKSLCLAAAEGLVRAVRAPGDTVIIGTGFIIGSLSKPETDGLVGAAVMARGLDLALGVKPVIVSESESIDTIAAACEAAELNVYYDFDKARSSPRSVTILPFTRDELEAPGEAKSILEKINPVAMVSIERPGRNEAGIYHGAMGRDISSLVAKIDHLFVGVRQRGGLTVAVGDLGNELGMGAISDVVKKVTPFGGRCLCPCGKGNACAIDSDITVLGAISDDAVYGILACMAQITGKPTVLHDAEMEERVVEAVVSHGGVDGPSECPKPAIDLVDARAHGWLIELMRNMFRYADEHTRIRPEFIEFVAYSGLD